MALCKRFKNEEEMANFILSNSVDLIDLCFTDVLGMWHHCTYASTALEFTDIIKGFAFDGSSIKLFCPIDASDILMCPDPTTCWIDPFQKPRVLHVTCSIRKSDGSLFSRCPRTISEKAVEFMKSTNIADNVIFGPEAEFFIFDECFFKCSPNKMMVELDHVDAYWNSDTNFGNRNNLACRVPPMSSYFPVAPIDSMQNLRNDMLLQMQEIGIPIEKHHHEVATCQHELGYVCQPMVESADILMSYKYVVRNSARLHGKTATFMPKPIYGESGSGMHCHQSLWKDGKNLFFDNDGQILKLSEIALRYIAGILFHAKSLLAFTNPTVNSYKRLVPGYEAPVKLAFSVGNRSAAIRIPNVDIDNPKTKRIEFRCPDPSACPYLAFAAMLMAGLDGIINKIEIPKPCHTNLYDSQQETEYSNTPESLDEALDALNTDNEYLTRGNVFSKDFINDYIVYKKKEIRSLSHIPHPKEFEMYYNC